MNSERRRRVVAIVSRQASFDFVLAQLCHQHDVVLVIRPCPGALRWDLFGRNPIRVGRNKLLGYFTRRFKRKAHASAARRFAGRLGLDEDIPQVEVPAPSINSTALEERIRKARPEVLFVFGSPVLRANIFRLAALCAINLHMGIAPRYRGMNTLFWALAGRDPDGLGFTLHRIDEGIDTGPVLAYGLPALDGGETETEVWLNCIELAGRVAGQVIAQPGAGQGGDVGTFYPAVRRTPLAELRYRLGGWRPPARPERIRILGAASTPPGSGAQSQSRGKTPNGQ